jgi:hypothetical protein
VTEHDESLDSPRDDFKGERYEEEDGDYEGNEDAGKEAGSRVYWKAVWNNAISMITKSNTKTHVTGDKRREKRTENEKPVSTARKAPRRIVAARLNFGTLKKHPSKDRAARTRNTTGDLRPETSPASQDKTPDKPEAQEREHLSNTSPEDSSSSSSSCPGENKDWQIIHDFESNEFWTFIEAPDVENDWDTVPEGDRFHQSAMLPTVNSRLRDVFEVHRAERETAVRRKNDRDGE